MWYWKGVYHLFCDTKGLFGLQKWSLITHHSIFVTHHSSPVTHHSSPITHHLKYPQFLTPTCLAHIFSFPSLNFFYFLGTHAWAPVINSVSLPASPSFSSFHFLPLQYQQMFISKPTNTQTSKPTRTQPSRRRRRPKPLEIAPKSNIESAHPPSWRSRRPSCSSWASASSASSLHSTSSISFTADLPPSLLNFLTSVSDSELFDRCSRFTLIFGSLTR